MLRFVRVLAFGLLGLVLIAWAASWLAARDPDGPAAAALGRVVAFLEPAGNGGLAAGLQLGGPFTLTDGAGQTVTDATYRGKWTLVYFGYTYCPDVCPTELQTISAALDRLGKAGDAIVPLFVTIDPERDTPATMQQYVKLFDDRLVGLTGTPAQIAAIAREYRVYYAKVTPKGESTYLMDHSSFSYLMGPDGRFRALLRPGMTAEAMATELAKQLRTD